MKIRIGCSEIPSGVLKNRYFETLRFVERADTLFNLPTAATCGRWKHGLPSDVTTSIVAWQPITHSPSTGYSRLNRPLTPEQTHEAGLFQDSQFVLDAVTQTLACANRLSAEAVVFRSPAEFSPSAHHRQRLEHFFTEIATAEQFDRITRVWEPQGLWELRSCVAIAQTLGIALSCDPIATDPLGEPKQYYHDLGIPAVYFRISDLGRKRGTDQSSLHRLADIASRYDKCWVVFTGPNMFRQAVDLQRIVDPVVSSV